MKSCKLLHVIALSALLILAVTSAVGQQWKFGVMSDTQWIGTDDGRNPGTCSVDIVRALNKQFILNGVKFVVQVGDLVDSTGSTTTSVKNTEDVRAAFAQELFNAGIGFYTFRGNHDSQPLARAEFRRVYPQTINGKNNSAPFDIFTVPNPDKAVQPFPFPAATSKPFVVGKNFSSPSTSQTGGDDWTGLSYSFDYNNARFVLLDQFSPLNSSSSANPYANAIHEQQPWIDAVLSGRSAGTHAFVFSHKGLITENHVDTLFGSSPAADPASQDAFITSLYQNGVRYYMQGHDHIHDRSLVSVTTGTPTDGHSAKVQNILCASDSSKFYTPGFPSNDDKYDVQVFGHKRQAQIAQELHTIGFYIYTVDGPKVTGDYYSSQLSNVVPSGCGPTDPNCEWLIPTLPALNFVKQESFGYSLNGKEFQVCQASQTGCNSSYTQVVDSFSGTTAKILGGVNGSTAQDFDGRSFLKTVDTGWSSATTSTASNVLTLWGMADWGSPRTAVYTLSLNYNPAKASTNGSFGLASKDAYGNWVNAVDLNQGTYSKRFVLGPWSPSYDLGTYGIDTTTNTAWAVINYNADFAVTSF